MNKPETGPANPEEYLSRISSWDRFDFYFKEAHLLRNVLRLYCRDRFVDERTATLEEIRAIVGLACQYLAVHYEKVADIMRTEEQAEHRGDGTWVVNQDAIEMYHENPWLLDLASHLSPQQIERMLELYRTHKHGPDDT